MRPYLLSIALLCALTSGAMAQTVPLQPALAGIGFLVGSWGGGAGKVAETGGTSRGSSSIESEANGSVLLRRDHTDLIGADGKPGGSFEQIMLVYPEGGTLHADYADGEHIIHYTSAVVVPGRSVVFSSTALPNAPTFHLTYEQTDPQTLTVRFEIAPPGESTFHPIATGTLRRSS